MSSSSLDEQRARFLSASEAAEQWLPSILALIEQVSFASLVSDTKGKLSSLDDWSQLKLQQLGGSAEAAWRAAGRSFHDLRNSVELHGPVIEQSRKELIRAAAESKASGVWFTVLESPICSAHLAAHARAFELLSQLADFRLDLADSQWTDGERWRLCRFLNGYTSQYSLKEHCALVSEMITFERDVLDRNCFFRELGPLPPSIFLALAESESFCEDQRTLKARLGEAIRQEHSKRWFVSVEAMNCHFPGDSWVSFLVRYADDNPSFSPEIRRSLLNAGVCADNKLHQVAKQ